MRYNMPIEIFYTVVPLILVLVFFAFTARDQQAIEPAIQIPTSRSRSTASSGRGTSTTSQGNVYTRASTSRTSRRT